VGRRAGNTSGLRELLIADREYRLPGCPQPGPWFGRVRDELLEDLKTGGRVEVGSPTLMSALLHAGQDYRRYAFGGADWGKAFLLDEHDRLTELPADR
jgi:hypothetical protein